MMPAGALGPGEVNGLPAHVLLVHATVLAVPVAALATVLSAVWPAARRRLGLGTPLLALLALACVPVTVSAGQWLAQRVGRTPLLVRHEQLGHGLLPWVGGLFAVAVLNHLWLRRRAQRADQPAPAVAERPANLRSTGGGTTMLQRPRVSARPGTGSGPAGRAVVPTVVATVLALVVSAGALVEVYRIGDSGARAAWQGNFSSTPRP